MKFGVEAGKETCEVQRLRVFDSCVYRTIFVARRGIPKHQTEVLTPLSFEQLI